MTGGEVALLPCPNPWCEPSGELPPTLRWYNHSAVVECASCGLEGPSRSCLKYDDDDEETYLPATQVETDAIAAWNTRAPTPPAAASEGVRGATKAMTKAGWAALAEWDTSEDCESDHAAMADAWTAMSRLAFRGADPAPGSAIPAGMVDRDVVLDAIRDRRDNDGGSASYRQACNHLIEAVQVLAYTPRPALDVGAIDRTKLNAALNQLVDAVRKQWGIGSTEHNLVRDIVDIIARLPATLVRSSGS